MASTYNNRNVLLLKWQAIEGDILVRLRAPCEANITKNYNTIYSKKYRNFIFGLEGRIEFSGQRIWILIRGVGLSSGRDDKIS